MNIAINFAETGKMTTFVAIYETENERGQRVPFFIGMNWYGGEKGNRGNH